jgi:hypothetical protein
MLVHLDATLRLFAPDYDPDAIRPKRVIPPRSLYLQMGEISDRCRDALRRANGEPVSSHDIAIAAMEEKGLDVMDSKVRADFIRRVAYAFSRMARRDQVVRVGHGRSVRWTLPSQSTAMAKE